MSPLAAVLGAALSPWVVVPGLLVEWWAVWFTLGRNFTLTSLLTLCANGSSLLVAAALLFGGALGDPAAAAPAAGPGALVVAALAWLAASVGIEALLLRGFMRRLRPGWSWNRYDLLTFTAAHALSVALAAWSAEAGAALA